MALLNVSKRRKLSDFFVNHHRKAMISCYIIGILWFLALPSDYLSNRTYFSENALLPGVVDRDFNPGSLLNGIVDSLKDEAKSVLGMPSSWIQGRFRQIGLDVFTQNFTLHYPFGSKSKYEGINIYAILRASKTSSTEAIVLSTPYRGFDSVHDSTLPSIALMIELAKYFRRHTYWSKDIIFLITEHEMVGFQAWLEAYHNIPTSDVIKSSSLSSYAGPIQGVINLEISSEKLSTIDVKIEGINGELPNLDLFNLAVELCAREGIVSTFHSRKTSYKPTYSFEAWKDSVITMLSMMSLQATGLTNGGHGLFQRFGIQAVTLTSSNDGSAKISLIHVGRVLEGIFRSLNNLLEKFHQSFFFYLLSSTRRYISIGLYMPPFALITLPVLIKALCLYIETKFVFSKLDDIKNINYSISLWYALDIIIISYILGIVMYCSLNETDIFQKLTKYSVEDSVYCIHVILLFFSIIFIHLYCKKCILKKDEYNVKLCVTLLNLGAFLYSLSLVNISMAAVLALILVFISFLLKFKAKFYLMYYLILIFINPITVIYFIVLGQSVFNDKHSTLNEHLLAAFNGHKKVLLYTVEDMYLFNNWNYKVVTLTLLPIWYQLWMLVTFKCS